VLLFVLAFAGGAVVAGVAVGDVVVVVVGGVSGGGVAMARVVVVVVCVGVGVADRGVACCCVLLRDVGCCCDRCLLLW